MGILPFEKLIEYNILAYYNNPITFQRALKEELFSYLELCIMGNSSAIYVWSILPGIQFPRSPLSLPRSPHGRFCKLIMYFI